MNIRDNKEEFDIGPPGRRSLFEGSKDFNYFNQSLSHAISN